MTRFEPGSFAVEGDHSANCTTITAKEKRLKLFLFTVVVRQVLVKSSFKIKITYDSIWTRVLCCWKRPLCQLYRNHCKGKKTKTVWLYSCSSPTSFSRKGWKCRFCSFMAVASPWPCENIFTPKWWRSHFLSLSLSLSLKHTLLHTHWSNSFSQAIGNTPLSLSLSASFLLPNSHSKILTTTSSLALFKLHSITCI